MTRGLALVLLLAAPALGAPQDFTQRGFLETRVTLYPQTAPGDSGRAVADALLRYEPSYKLSPWLRISGAFDARTDTHRQVARAWRLDWRDRGRERPPFALRRLSATLSKGPVTAALGKQFIRWGKTDIVNPTDRFAPRDFLGVVDNDFLAVTGARVTYGRTADTLDVVWIPRFTPSRIPLLNQRWTVLPEEAEGLPLRDLGGRFPRGAQLGVRWNHVGAGYEYSVSFYNGFNHLPLIDARVELSPFRVDLTRVYPKLRMYGGDAAIPLPWFTVKGEAAYFASPGPRPASDDGAMPRADQYVLYVIQLERQAGEWFLVGGYAGEAVTAARAARTFAPDRGLTRAFLGRAGYSIDANRSVAFEAAVRQNGKGTWVKTEYSRASGQHWRATLGFTLIRGEAGDFLGQYHRNSHASLVLRYSF